MPINMLRLQCLIILLLMTNSNCNRKLWSYTANVRDKQNWVEGKHAEHCIGLIFPETGSLNDFVIGQISVKSVVLPRRGDIGLYSGSRIIFDENSPDLINCIKLKPVDAKFWDDIRGWKDLDDPGNSAIPYYERLPSRYDDVIFNDVMDSRILSMLRDSPVKSIIVLKGNSEDLMLSDLYSNGKFIITNETCSDPTGCSLSPMKVANENDVCYYASMLEPIPNCENPIVPLGFCEIPRCGASILIRNLKVGFRLERIKHKLQDYQSFTHASKVPGTGHVQVVFAEINFTAVSLDEARDFYNLLRADNSYYSGDIQLMLSGLPLSDDYKIVKNAISMSFGSLLVALVVFGLLLVVFSPVFGNVDIRTRLLGSRPLSTYVLRYDNIHDRDCTIDTAPSVSSSLVNLNHSFENPVYDQSTSRSTSNETLASVKQLENPSGTNQAEAVEERYECSKVQCVEEVQDEAKVIKRKMEQVVEDIEKKMKKTDAQLDTLALQVENIEQEIFTEEGQELEVHNLLKSVSEVKDNYQNLRKDLLEVQGLQKQLSSSLNLQLKMMQSKFNGLKKRVIVAKHSQINSKATELGDNK